MTTNTDQPGLDNVIHFPVRQPLDDETSITLLRDPRTYSFALLIVERRMFGGVNGFHWFKTESEAAQFLRQGIWDYVHEDESSLESRDLFQRSLATTSRIDDPWLRPVLGAQEVIDVVWYGTFESLVSGDDVFTASITEDFQSASASGIPANQDRDAFIGYLTIFRGLR